MIIKHSGFDDSAVMRELERLEAKKNPDAVWKPKPVVKKASSFKSKDPVHNMIMLAGKLRDAGRIEDADRLLTKIAAYQKTADNLISKTADTHLYRAIDEDGDDLLEFAYPDGDVEIAKSEKDYGMVETPQSAHKKIVDIVMKSPTGKYASTKETLLKSLAYDLGLRKKAYDELEEAIKDFDILIKQASLPTYMIYDAGLASNVLGNLGVYFKSVAYEYWVFWAHRGVLDNQDHLMANDAKGNQLSIFKANSGPFDFFKTLSGGSDKVLSAAADYERRAGKKQNQEHWFAEWRVPTFYKIFKPLVEQANENIKVTFNRLVSNVKKLSIVQNFKEHPQIIESIKNDMWLLNSITYGGERDKLKESINIILNAAPKRAQQLINKDIEERMLKIKHNYDIAKNTFRQKRYILRAQFCEDLSNAISANIQDPIKALIQASQTNKYVTTMAIASTNEEALRNLEENSKDMLAKAQNAKTASAKNINKNAQIPDDVEPVDPMRGLTGGEQSPSPAPAKPAPAAARGPVRQREKDRWLESVQEWQQAQDREGSNWYKAVESLQHVLNSFATKAAARNVIKPNSAHIISNTGYKEHRGAFFADGKWGPNTSAAVLEVKRILDHHVNTNQIKVDTKLLDVDPNGYLSVRGKGEKDLIGQQAEVIIQLISTGADQLGISVSGTATSTDPAGGTAAANANTVFDMVPKDPSLMSDSHDPNKKGNIPLTGRDLSDLDLFEDWLEINEIINGKQIVGYWNRIFGNLRNRAIHAMRVSTGDADKSKSQNYIDAVASLIRKYRQAIQSWLATNPNKNEPISLSDLANHAADKTPKETATSTGTGAAGTGAASGAGAGSQGTQVDVLTDQNAPTIFPIGKTIYPGTWKQNWGSSLSIYNTSVAGHELSEFISFRINIDQIQNATSNLDRALSAMTSAGVQISYPRKLRVLRLSNEITSDGVPFTNLPEMSLDRQIVEQKFKAYIVDKMARALQTDVIKVSQAYGRQEFGQGNKEWADIVHQNAQYWSGILNRISEMAKRSFHANRATTSNRIGLV